MQDTKENIKLEVVKDEETSSTEAGTVVKEESLTPPVKKENEEETEVRMFFSNNASFYVLWWRYFYFLYTCYFQKVEDADKEKSGSSSESPNVKKEGGVKQEKCAVKKEPVKTEGKDHREAQKVKESKENEMILKDLKAQLK